LKKIFEFTKQLVPRRLKIYIWSILDWSKIYIGYRIVPKVNIQNFSDAYSPHLRVVFVKHESADDLYTTSSKSISTRELIFSSIHRSGPVGLFTKFNADFSIVNCDQAEECTSLKCGTQNCERLNVTKSEKFRNEILYRGNGEEVNRFPQSHYSVCIDSIDWGGYDIVISMDIAIPRNFPQDFPRTIWCYMPSDPYTEISRKSHERPLFNYDLFLNQRYRSIRIYPRPKFHEIDFPYHFQYYGCFHEVLGIPLDYYTKHGVFVENRTSSGLSDMEFRSLERFGVVRYPKEESLENVIVKELQSKYFLSLTRGVIRSRIWGNAIIEAIACGCIAFGDPDEYTNIDLFTPFTVIRSFDEFLRKVEVLEADPGRYLRELNYQRNLLNYLCFVRPLQEIISRGRRLKGRHLAKGQ